MTIRATIAPVNAAAANARIERERAAREAGLAAAEARPVPVVEWTDHASAPARAIRDGAFVAIPTNGRRNAREWAVLPRNAPAHVDNVVCYLTRAEVDPWLIRQARG